MVTAGALTAILLVAALLVGYLRVHVPQAQLPVTAEAEPPAADRAPRLLPQFTTVVGGSRAPPAASA